MATFIDKEKTEAWARFCSMNIEVDFPEIVPILGYPHDGSSFFGLRANGTKARFGDPLLRWLPEKDKENQWHLVLEGAQGTYLRSVLWNDKLGFKELVKAMSDVEALKIQLALTEPLYAERLNNVLKIEKLADEFKESMQNIILPHLTQEDLGSLLKMDTRTTSYAHSPSANEIVRINEVHVEVGSRKIPIAFEVAFYPVIYQDEREEYARVLKKITGLEVIEGSKIRSLIADFRFGLYKYKDCQDFWLVRPEVFPLVEQYLEGAIFISSFSTKWEQYDLVRF